MICLNLLYKYNLLELVLRVNVGKKRRSSNKVLYTQNVFSLAQNNRIIEEKLLAQMRSY